MSGRKPIYYATLGMSIFGHYGILASTGLPYWRWSSWQVSNPLYGRIPTFDGIWWQCMSLKDGGFTCSNYGLPTLFVDTGIQAARGLMVIACILSFIAMLLNILIVDTCIMLPNGSRQKRILALISGICQLITCVCSLGATVYFAWQVTYQYYSPIYQEREFTYMYGPCLYVIWIAMGLLAVGGIILVVDVCRSRKQEDDFMRYRPPSFTFPELEETRRGRKPQEEYL